MELEIHNATPQWRKDPKPKKKKKKAKDIFWKIGKV